jgi:hypothetical protein
MLIFKKAITAVYFSETTEATFWFRQSSKKAKEELELYIRSESDHNNRKHLLASWALNKESYYAGWLLEEFNGVKNEQNNSHSITNFDIENKAMLIDKLKESDSQFLPWFEKHCEPAEKKIEEHAAAGEMVDTPDVQELLAKREGG